MDKIKKQGLSGALAIYGLTVALIFMAKLLPFLILAIPVILVFSIAAFGYIYGGIAVVGGLATGYLFGTMYPTILIAAFLPVAFAAGYAIREKKRFRDSVALSCAAVLMGAILSVAVLQWMTGMSVLDYAATTMESALRQVGEQEVKLYYQFVRSADLISGAVTQSALEAASAEKAIKFMVNMTYDFVNQLFVYVILVYSLIMGYLGYIIPRIVIKKRGIEVVRIPSFSNYMLPKRFWAGALILGIIAYIGADEGWSSFDILFLTLYNIFIFVFMMQGISFLDYIYKMRKLSTGARVALHILTALVFSGVLAIVGLMENAFNMRKRIQPRKVV